MHQFIIILICGVCSGCTQRTSQSRRSAPTDHFSFDEKKAIEIARTTLSTNAGFRAGRVSYQVSPQGSNWWVTVWSEPSMPGGFCIVEIKHDGKVSRII